MGEPQNGRPSGAVKAAIAAYSLIAAACLALLVIEVSLEPPAVTWRRLLLSAITVAVALTATIPLGFGRKHKELDLTGAGLGISIALIGPAPAALALILGKVITELIRRRQPLKAIANIAALAIAATVGSQLALLMGHSAPGLGPNAWPGVAVAAITVTFLTAALITGVIHLDQHQAWVARLTRIDLLCAAGDAAIATGTLAEYRFKNAVVFLTLPVVLGALRIYRNTTTHDDEGSVINGLAKASSAVKTLDPEVAMTELADRCGELFGVTDMEIDLVNWPPDNTTWRFTSGSDRHSYFAQLVADATPADTIRSDTVSADPASPDAVPEDVARRPSSQRWQTYPIVVDDEPLGELRIQTGKRAPRRAERQIMDAFLATTTTALHHARGHLRELQAARRDPLTRLINRAGFAELVTSILTGELPVDPTRVVSPHPDAPKGPPEPEVFAVLFLDLNFFKPINDKYGHPVGDELLVNVARRLKSNVRNMDEVARVGGDEFVIVLRNIGTAKAAADVAENLLRRIREPMTLTLVDKTLRVSGSIGVVTSLDAGSVEELTRCADVAMYQAKHNRRGSVALYEPSIAPEMPEESDLLEELEAGIPNGELLVHYQPKVDLMDGTIVGCEALVRWQHPTRGFLGPGQFLPAVEHHPLIVDLTMEVLRTVITEAGTWRNNLLPLGVEPPHIAVNVARECLAHRDFPQRVIGLLNNTNVPSELLTLEITESSELGRSETVDEVVADLRARGIKLSVDDFGTGHSNMTFFRRVPVDEVKIEGRFVREMADNKASAAIVKSTIALGHGYEITVVAEGIETAEQLAEVTAAGAHIGQGYFLHKPMPVREFRVLLHDHFHDTVNESAT